MWASSGPSGYWRRVSTATSTPGSSSVDSETTRAIFSGTSDAIRTGSNREPGAVSIVARMSDASIPRRAPSRWATSWRRPNGKVGRPDANGPRRDVGDEEAALAVVDQSPGRRERLLHRALGLGAGRERLAVGDLEVGEARRQPAEHEDGDDPERDEPQRASIALGLGLEVRAVHQSTRSVSRRRATTATASGPNTAARIVSYTADGITAARAASVIGAVDRAVVETSSSME